MNFLELCQTVARESGTIAGLPSFTTVSNASGRLAKLVGWTSDAWRDIQNERTDWTFLRHSFEKALTIDAMVYTGGGLALDPSVAAWLQDNKKLRTMSLYDPAIGQSDESELSYFDWTVWRQRYDRGTHDAGRPQYWARSPRGELCLGPKPDKAYLLRGEYRRTPQILSADADVPICPEQFHGVIVGEALRLMANSDEAFQVVLAQASRYDRLRNPLVIDQTPPVEDMYGAPLA